MFSQQFSFIHKYKLVLLYLYICGSQDVLHSRANLTLLLFLLLLHLLFATFSVRSFVCSSIIINVYSRIHFVYFNPFDHKQRKKNQIEKNADLFCWVRAVAILIFLQILDSLLSLKELWIRNEFRGILPQNGKKIGVFFFFLVKRKGAEETHRYR